MILEEMPSIAPLHFFTIKGEVYPLDKKKGLTKQHQIADLSDFLGQEHFADLSIGSGKDTLLLQLDVHQPFSNCYAKSFEKGDALELFIDTRALNTSYMNKYCHHFYFLPQLKEGIMGEEITKLRLEDARPLANPSELLVSSEFHPKRYRMTITLGKNALYGFDPDQYKKMNLHFVVHRYQKTPQYFAFSKNLFKGMLNPKMWAEFTIKDPK